MERRIALKHIAMTVGGLVALPAWADGWNKWSARPIQPFLSLQQEAVLAEITETLIPTSDTPGAKTLGVPNFIQKMVEDCYEKDVQQNLKDGLATVNTLANQAFGKSFAEGDARQRQEVLKKMEQATEPAQMQFFSLVKNLTIQGYTTSEFVLTKYLNYNMAPGHYSGCVPVPVKAISQTK